jgi:hypothetical protein
VEKGAALRDMEIDKIVQSLGNKIKQSQSVADLWTSNKSFESHVTKRIALGHINNADDYLNKISHSLLNSTRYAIATGGTINLVELKSKEWSVIFNERGEIKTAYKIEADMPSFTDNHKRLGYKVYENDISDGIRKELNGLFSAR